MKMTPYEKIKKRCAEDPVYRAKYLAMKAKNNQARRDRVKAKMSPEELEDRRRRNEEKRIAAVKAAHARQGHSVTSENSKPERHPDLPWWKKDKPGRIVSLCGWNGWG